MLAELVDHVVGVDPDRDWITLAVLDARSPGVVAEDRFAATGDGYDEAIDFVDRHSVETERACVIEGSAGRGLAVALERRGEWVIEFDRSAWWLHASTDTRRVQARAWLGSGRRVEVSTSPAQTVRFRAARWLRGS